MVTNRTSTSYYGLWQKFTPVLGSGKTYVRYLKSNFEWDGGFKLLEENVINVTGSNAFGKNARIEEFPFNKITHTPINTAFAQTEGFPEGKAGELVTSRLSSSYYMLWQTFLPTEGSGKKYIRFVDSSFNWKGDFIEM